MLVLQFRLTECQQVASADPDRVSSLLEEIRGDLKSIQEDDIRTVSHQLYPPSVMMGVVPALRSLQERFQHAVPIELRVDAAIQSREKDNRALFPEELRVGIYRIVEEALENILKDSRATRAKLELYHEDDGFLSLVIADNGVGLETTGISYGFGLLTMKDYAEALGGSCEIESEPENGAQIIVALPIPKVSGPNQNGKWSGRPLSDLAVTAPQ